MTTATLEVTPSSAPSTPSTPRPSVWPLWVAWLIFWPAVLVWAPIKAYQAKKAGYSTGAYWAPFVTSVLPIVVLGTVLFAASAAMHGTSTSASTGSGQPSTSTPSAGLFPYNVPVAAGAPTFDQLHAAYAQIGNDPNRIIADWLPRFNQALASQSRSDAAQTFFPTVVDKELSDIQSGRFGLSASNPLKVYETKNLGDTSVFGVPSIEIWVHSNMTGNEMTTLDFTFVDGHWVLVD